MSKLEHTRPLMNKLTDIYKSGGVKHTTPNSSCDEINLDTHACGRLFARAVQRVALVVSILFLLGACQKATLISSDEAEKNGRGTEGEAPKDSITVTPNFDINGWGEGIDAGFTFGGKEQEGE